MPSSKKATAHVEQDDIEHAAAADQSPSANNLNSPARRSIRSREAQRRGASPNQRNNSRDYKNHRESARSGGCCNCHGGCMRRCRLRPFWSLDFVDEGLEKRYQQFSAPPRWASRLLYVIGIGYAAALLSGPTWDIPSLRLLWLVRLLYCAVAVFSFFADFGLQFLQRGRLLTELDHWVLHHALRMTFVTAMTVSNTFAQMEAWSCSTVDPSLRSCFRVVNFSNILSIVVQFTVPIKFSWNAPRGLMLPVGAAVISLLGPSYFGGQPAEHLFMRPFVIAIYTVLSLTASWWREKEDRANFLLAEELRAMEQVTLRQKLRLEEILRSLCDDEQLSHLLQGNVVVERTDMALFLVAQIHDYATWCRQMDQRVCLLSLDALYRFFDLLIAEVHLDRIVIRGDAYVCGTGLRGNIVAEQKMSKIDNSARGSLLGPVENSVSPTSRSSTPSDRQLQQAGRTSAGENTSDLSSTTTSGARNSGSAGQHSRRGPSTDSRALVVVANRMIRRAVSLKPKPATLKVGVSSGPCSGALIPGTMVSYICWGEAWDQAWYRSNIAAPGSLQLNDALDDSLADAHAEPALMIAARERSSSPKRIPTHFRDTSSAPSSPTASGPTTGGSGRTPSRLENDGSSPGSNVPQRFSASIDASLPGDPIQFDALGTPSRMTISSSLEDEGRQSTTVVATGETVSSGSSQEHLLSKWCFAPGWCRTRSTRIHPSMLCSWVMERRMAEYLTEVLLAREPLVLAVWTCFVFFLFSVFLFDGTLNVPSITVLLLSLVLICAMVLLQRFQSKLDIFAGIHRSRLRVILITHSLIQTVLTGSTFFTTEPSTATRRGQNLHIPVVLFLLTASDGLPLPWAFVLINSLLCVVLFFIFGVRQEWWDFTEVSGEPMIVLLFYPTVILARSVTVRRVMSFIDGQRQCADVAQLNRDELERVLLMVLPSRVIPDAVARAEALQSVPAPTYKMRGAVLLTLRFPRFEIFYDCIQATRYLDFLVEKEKDLVSLVYLDGDTAVIGGPLRRKQTKSSKLTTENLMRHSSGSEPTSSNSVDPSMNSSVRPISTVVENADLNTAAEESDDEGRKSMAKNQQQLARYPTSPTIRDLDRLGNENQDDNEAPLPIPAVRESIADGSKIFLADEPSVIRIAGDSSAAPIQEGQPSIAPTTVYPTVAGSISRAERRFLVTAANPSLALRFQVAADQSGELSSSHEDGLDLVAADQRRSEDSSDAIMFSQRPTVLTAAIAGSRAHHRSAAEQAADERARGAASALMRIGFTFRALYTGTAMLHRADGTAVVFGASRPVFCVEGTVKEEIAAVFHLIEAQQFVLSKEFLQLLSADELTSFCEARNVRLSEVSRLRMKNGAWDECYSVIDGSAIPSEG
jgi:hypothetical protein